MEEKINAIYVMVRQEELKPEDKGSYEGPLARQKEICEQFLKEKLGGKIDGPIQVYDKRKELLMDMDRHIVKRLVVYSLDRLGANKEDIDALVFELGMENIELLLVNQ